MQFGRHVVHCDSKHPRDVTWRPESTLLPRIPGIAVGCPITMSRPLALMSSPEPERLTVGLDSLPSRLRCSLTLIDSVDEPLRDTELSC